LITGYTTGVFDLFHIGHLNILRNAKQICDKLIVGVTTDEYCRIYKGEPPYIPFKHRFDIINSIKFVDKTVPQVNHNKIEAWDKYKFDIMIVGNDWENTDKWKKYEEQFNKVNVEIAYLPRTKNVSSSQLKNLLK
tara:strand:- start:745 stop:1149 length:405 start_codon:yes stop_codon:yes gene_type:complete